MKKQKLFMRKFIFAFINGLFGFAAFLFIVLLGELLSGSFVFFEFYFEPVHFQIALLGGILQGSMNLFKYQ